VAWGVERFTGVLPEETLASLTGGSWCMKEDCPNPPYTSRCPVDTCKNAREGDECDDCTSTQTWVTCAVLTSWPDYCIDDAPAGKRCVGTVKGLCVTNSCVGTANYYRDCSQVTSVYSVCWF
jgi:hypothetical protein